jgi:hypothetical protein
MGVECERVKSAARRWVDYDDDLEWLPGELLAYKYAVDAAFGVVDRNSVVRHAIVP